MKRGPERAAGRKLPRPFRLPWGAGQIVEEISVDREHWEPTIQLLEYADGSHSLRFCYYHGRSFGRGPLLVGEQELARLAQEARGSPGIRAMLNRLAQSPGDPDGRG